MQERDQDLAPAAVTPKTREAPAHRTAGQELAQFPFHEARQALTAAQARLEEKRLEVFANHLMQDALLGMASDVCVLSRTAG